MVHWCWTVDSGHGVDAVCGQCNRTLCQTVTGYLHFGRILQEALQCVARLARAGQVLDLQRQFWQQLFGVIADVVQFPALLASMSLQVDDEVLLQRRHYLCPRLSHCLSLCNCLPQTTTVPASPSASACGARHPFWSSGVGYGGVSWRNGSGAAGPGPGVRATPIPPPPASPHTGL